MVSTADKIMEIITSKSGYSGGALQLSSQIDKMGIDSMEIVSLIFDIEERFNIELPFNANEDIKGKTVANLIKMVDQLVAAKAKTA